MPGTSIAPVTEQDLDDLLPLLRGYCDFYEVAPPDAQLLALCRALLADPEREGVQLLARDAGGRAVGFATIFWTWQTLDAGRIGVMNDLFVHPDARGTGLADSAHRGVRGPHARARREGPHVGDRARQRPRPDGLRPGRRDAQPLAHLRAGPAHPTRSGAIQRNFARSDGSLRVQCLFPPASSSAPSAAP